jgi:hypothetical protein
VRNSPTMLAVLGALMLTPLAAAAETPAPPAQPPASPAQPPGIRIAAPEARLELRLPAAYWKAMTPQELAQQAQGGCTPNQLPPGLVLEIRDADEANVGIIVTRSPETFLMRNKDDLETFENAVMKSIAGQGGAAISDVESGYEKRDGMVIHHYALTATPTGGGGGCAAAPQQSGPPQKVRFVFSNYFVHPEGEDAFYYRVNAGAPVKEFSDLKPEIDYILGSVRFTGKLAESFFVPDAPADKVPTAKQAAQELSPRRSVPGWMLAAGLVLIIYLFLRRRKQPKV